MRAVCVSPNAPDETLMKAIAQNDRYAMALLYERHGVRTYRFVRRITDNATLAEDIVSEVFLDVWQHADGFKAKSRVSTWLLAIARNKTRSALRRHSEEPLDDHQATAVIDTADDPEIVILNKDRSAVIRKCLSQLSAPHREVIDLIYYHEQSVNEVAQIIGAPASTIKTRMFHARHRIEKLLKGASAAKTVRLPSHTRFAELSMRTNGKHRDNRQESPHP